MDDGMLDGRKMGSSRSCSSRDTTNHEISPPIKGSSCRDNVSSDQSCQDNPRDLGNLQGSGRKPAGSAVRGLAAVMRSLLYLFALCVSGIQWTHGTYKKLEGCPVVTNEKCDSQYVKFYLYTRKSKPEEGEFVRFLSDGTNNLTESSFNPKLKSKVIIHGYTTDHRLDSLLHIKDEYLKREDMNVWFLDWAVLCPEPCYLSSVYNMDYVGSCLASFVNTLARPPDLHVIGFSLGGHVAALAANHLRPYRIPWITGLDPALPLFVGFAKQRRLSPDDGDFVDVLHTNSFFQGNFLRMGDVDFFVNGGINQPGCGSLFKSIECSHLRAPWLYAESINSESGFWGWKCNKYFDALREKCQIEKPFYLMGDAVSKSSRGLVYVPTLQKPPFAKGKPVLPVSEIEVTAI